MIFVRAQRKNIGEVNFRGSGVIVKTKKMKKNVEGRTEKRQFTEFFLLRLLCRNAFLLHIMTRFDTIV